MYSQEAVVNNQVGLHARPATFFIQKANEFKSAIWVEKDERKVNAKSLLGVLSLGIVKGTPIKLIADGPDEKEAVEALYKMISSESTMKRRRHAAPFLILEAEAGGRLIRYFSMLFLGLGRTG